MVLQSINNFPSPNWTATKILEFEMTSKKGHMYLFGASREVYNKVYLKHNPTKELNVPGLGACKPKSFVGETYKYSMRPKTNDIRIEITPKK